MTNLYPKEPVRSPSGTTQAIKELVEGAFKQGLNVKAVLRLYNPFNGKGFKIGKDTVNGVNVFDLPRFGVRRFFIPFISQFITKLLFINKEEIDVIVCHRSANLYFSKRIFGPSYAYVLIIHQSDLFDPLLGYALKNANKILVRSHSLMARLKTLSPNVCVSGIVHSGVDIQKARQSRASMVVGGKLIPLRLVYAGSLIRLKNVDVIIEAMHTLKAYGVNVALNIFGEGRERESLNQLVNKLGLTREVIFHGHVDNDVVLSHMNSSNLYVMVSAPESFGLSYIEAMSQGCVVIGHKGWGIDGLIKDGRDGFLVSNSSYRYLLDKLTHYLFLPQEQKTMMHDRAYQLALENSREKCASNYKKYIEE